GRLQARTGEIGDAEALAVGARRETGRALEQPAEERRILVTDAPADLVDRSLGTFEPAFRVLDAQALHVGDRAQARGAYEAPLESALGQPGTADHRVDRIGDREVLAEPALPGLDVGVAVVAASLEDDVRRQSVVVPLQREAAC